MTIWTSKSIDDGLVVYRFYDDGSVRCECKRGKPRGEAETFPWRGATSNIDIDLFERGDKRAQEHVKDWELELEVHRQYDNQEAIESINQLLRLLTK